MAVDEHAVRGAASKRVDGVRVGGKEPALGEIGERADEERVVNRHRAAVDERLGGGEARPVVEAARLVARPESGERKRQPG